MKNITLFLFLLLGIVACKNHIANARYHQECYSEIPPQSILIETGLQEVVYPGGKKTTDTVGNFSILKYEETNRQYHAYLTFLKRYHYEKEYIAALPDTTIWRTENNALSENDKEYLVNNYFQNPVFNDYPVVGLNTRQISDYASWKTNRINEMILIREGVFDYDTTGTDSNNVFKMDPYFVNPGRYTQRTVPKYASYSIRMEDGVFLASYRLPSLAEWQSAFPAVQNRRTFSRTPQQTKSTYSEFKKGYYSYFFVKEKPATKADKTDIAAIKQKLHLCSIDAVNEMQPNKEEIHQNPQLPELVTEKNDSLFPSVIKPGDKQLLIKAGNNTPDGATFPGYFISSFQDGRSPAIAGFRLVQDFVAWPSKGKIPFKSR